VVVDLMEAGDDSRERWLIFSRLHATCNVCQLQGATCAVDELPPCLPWTELGLG
jgi:hypothetical protein